MGIWPMCFCLLEIRKAAMGTVLVLSYIDDSGVLGFSNYSLVFQALVFWIFLKEVKAFLGVPLFAFNSELVHCLFIIILSLWKIY
jgi:hypothetical protein